MLLKISCSFYKVYVCVRARVHLSFTFHIRVHDGHVQAISVDCSSYNVFKYTFLNKIRTIGHRIIITEHYEFIAAPQKTTWTTHFYLFAPPNEHARIQREFKKKKNKKFETKTKLISISTNRPSNQTTTMEPYTWRTSCAKIKCVLQCS